MDAYMSSHFKYIIHEVNLRYKVFNDFHTKYMFALGPLEVSYYLMQ